MNNQLTESTNILIKAFETIEANQNILNFDSSTLPDFQAREFIHSQKVIAPNKIRMAKAEIVDYIRMIGYDSQLKARILAKGKNEQLADKIDREIEKRYRKYKGMVEC